MYINNSSDGNLLLQSIFQNFWHQLNKSTTTYQRVINENIRLWIPHYKFRQPRVRVRGKWPIATWCDLCYSPRTFWNIIKLTWAEVSYFVIMCLQSWVFIWFSTNTCIYIYFIFFHNVSIARLSDSKWKKTCSLCQQNELPVEKVTVSPFSFCLRTSWVFAQQDLLHNPVVLHSFNMPALWGDHAYSCVSIVLNLVPRLPGFPREGAGPADSHWLKWRQRS